MAEKANMADNQDSSSDEDTNREAKITGNSSDVLGARKQSTEGSTQKFLNQVENNLPEDQEITSDKEE